MSQVVKPQTNKKSIKKQKFIRKSSKKCVKLSLFFLFMVNQRKNGENLVKVIDN